MPDQSSTDARNMAEELAEVLGGDDDSLKLLQSLESYRCSDKIRWNSIEGFKGDLFAAIAI